jgi:TonB family protein
VKALSVRNLSAEDAFQKFLWASLIAHSLFFIGASFKTMVFSSDEIKLQNAIRVDVVALPDKLPTTESPAKPEKPPSVDTAPPKAETAKPEPKKPDAVALKKDTKDLKKAQEEAMKRLKQQQAQKEALERLKGAKSDTPEPPKKKNLYAGNQINQGDSVMGLERIAFDEYLSALRDRVNSNFTIPNWLANNPTLKASVEVTIDDDGKIIKIGLVKSSGNPTFDGASTAAVQASAPFPPVPERLTRAWSSFTIQFNFPDT